MDVRLRPCCRDALGRIRQVSEVMGVVRALIGSSPFVLLMSSNPPEGMVTIATSDWDVFRQAVHGVGDVNKRLCRDIATLEEARHPGGQLNAFWRNLRQSFE